MDLYLPLIGVVIGALLTGGVSWLNDRKQHERTQAAERTRANLELCAAFLETIDEEELFVMKWFSAEDLLPGEMGHDEELSKSRAHLSSIELRCPKSVYDAAVDVMKSFEGWAFRTNVEWIAFREARSRFVDTVQNDL